MKRLLLVALGIGIGVAALAQYKPIQKHRNVMATQSSLAIDNSIPGDKPANIYVSNKSILVDAQVMMTNYDLETNGSMGQSRLVYYPDGSMSATATWSQDPGGTWPGRGTGYNYSANGTTWGTNPTARVEALRAGWPSICPCGPTGECIVSHQSATASMLFNKRTTKGTGTWTQTLVPNPSGATGMLWPRICSSGANHNTIHIIALTPPTGNGGTVYNGMDGALLYIKSTDGGATWGTWQQLAGMTSAEYVAFSGDDYCWANPRTDTICFSVSSAFMDTFIMKSTDAGATWTKTVVYASPYNLVGVNGNSALRFYTSDNTSTVALDKHGKAHVSFGLMSDSISGSTSYNYWPYTQGLVYWNESMPSIQQDKMNPDTLDAHGQLVGWVQDTMIYYQGASALAYYRACSLTGMPSMTIDDNNYLFVTWTSPTVLMDPSSFMLRHIFGRTAQIGAGTDATWNDNIYDMNQDFLYNFSECVWPSMAMKSSATQYFFEFMADDLAGAFLNTAPGVAGQSSITDNFITVMKVDKSSVGVGVNDQKKDVTPMMVSRNYPNP
ncbi:MAG: sialidase family protein, partial [Bacteroidota bacterium]